MKKERQPLTDDRAARWAAELMDEVRQVLAEHPDADPDNVRHTLILLREPPLERLRRSLLRGRATAQSDCGARFPRACVLRRI